MRMITKRLRRKKKGQTALEYALVVGAISLVFMAAWNLVGRDVQDAITGSIRSDINDNLVKGNAAIRN